MRFTNGLKDGLPIALGYVSVAFAYAISAMSAGFPAWFPVLVSFTNFTGTGQFAGTNLIAAGAGVLEIAATMLVINIRYTLMSVSLSQKLDSGVKLWQRSVLALGVTDENYAVAIRSPKRLNFSYLSGLMLCSFCGWVGGTALGALLGDILPEALMNALGIALFAMFVAIILPAARDDKKVLLLVALSTAASCLFYFTPVLDRLSDGWVIIICSVVCTAAVAFLFPKKEDDAENAPVSNTAAAGGAPVSGATDPGGTHEEDKTAPDTNGGADENDDTGLHNGTPPQGGAGENVKTSPQGGADENVKTSPHGGADENGSDGEATK